MEIRRPILVGRLTPGDKPGNHLLEVWCPCCEKIHTHGWPKQSASNIIEHRNAHCGGGPLQEFGYFIMPENRIESLERMKVSLKYLA